VTARPDAGRVMTVNGPVDPAELGFTLPHEHLWINLFEAPGRWDLNGVLQDADLVVGELAHFGAAGGGAVVELSLPGNGRDPDRLRDISGRSGLHVVMGCGWYRQPYYPEADLIDRRSPDDLAEQLVREIERGAGEGGVRPGIIGEIGCHKSWMSAQEERVHRAAARAQVATGLPLTTHSIASPIGLWQLDVFAEEGVDLTRVAVGHADSYPVLDYHREIVRRGAFVQFDKVGGIDAFYTPEARLVELIRALVAEGFVEQVLLSHDICFRSELKTFGGRGYDDIPSRFVPALREAGLSEQEIEQMTVRNPQRLLTIR
jgi:phosphotriesterase-related protein